MRARASHAPPLLQIAGLTLAASIIASCTGPLSQLKPVPRDRTPVDSVCGFSASSRCTGEVTFSYLGVGGFIICAGDEAVMTSPSFTHPRLLRVVTPKLLHIRSDSAAVESRLRRILGPDPSRELARVQSVLVGHSHYDHLMDLPYLMRAYLQHGRVVGGLTTKRILMGDPWLRDHASQIDSLSLEEAATPWRVGRWVRVGKQLRVMAVSSGHASNFFGITIASGTAARDYEHLPTTGWGWKMGDPYAYVIDLLDAVGRPAFRVLYHDAAAEPIDVMLPPFSDVDQRRVDVAIICGGNFDNVDGYPTVLAAALHPRIMILGHWENFFRPMDAPLAPIPFTNTGELAARLERAAPGHWVTLEPGGRMRVLY
jgi:hypothetical protein